MPWDRSTEPARRSVRPELVRDRRGLINQQVAGLVVSRRRIEPAVADQDPIGGAIDGIGRPLQGEENDRVGGGRADSLDARQLFPQPVGRSMRSRPAHQRPAAVLIDEPASEMLERGDASWPVTDDPLLAQGVGDLGDLGVRPGDRESSESVFAQAVEHGPSSDRRPARGRAARRPWPRRARDPRSRSRARPKCCDQGRANRGEGSSRVGMVAIGLAWHRSPASANPAIRGAMPAPRQRRRPIRLARPDSRLLWPWPPRRCRHGPACSCGGPRCWDAGPGAHRPCRSWPSRP